MVLPIGTARGTTLRRTTSLTLLGAIAILLAIPTFAFATPVALPSTTVAPNGPSTHSGAIPLGHAIATLAQGAGPAFGVPLHCSAATVSTAHCDNAPIAASPSRPASTTAGWQNATFGEAPLGSIGETYGASMAWDPVDTTIVYFGGCDQLACPDNETWVFYLGSWYNDTNPLNAPPAVFFASMDFDYQANAVMLFGGCGAFVCPMNETWIYSGGAWIDVSAPFCFIGCLWAPSPRMGAAMAFANDSVDNETVLFGGCLDGSCYATDNLTYEWYGALYAWLPITTSTAPTPRGFSSMAYDPNWGALILFGGCYNGATCTSDETWQFNNGAWLNLTGLGSYFGYQTPPARGAAMMTYDALRQELLLIGGYGGGSLNDTWAFACPYFCGWFDITPAANVPGQIDLAAMASESTFYVPLFHGGICSCSSQALDTTWVYENVLDLTPTVGPNPAPALTLVTLASGANGGTLPYFIYWLTGDGGYLFGDGTWFYSSPGTYQVGAWVYDAYGVFVNYSVMEVVTTTMAQASVADPTTDVNVADAFSSPAATGGTEPYVYNWTFGDGSWAIAGATTSHTFAAVGTYQVNLTVTDVNLLTNVTSVSVQVVAGPTVAIAASASTIDAGGSATFTPTASGGVGTYTYAWTLGDGTSSTLTAPGHPYAAAGTYHVNVTVTDAVGGTATASVAITVNAAVAATATATPATLTVGGTVNFSAAASGGSGTFTYVWTFGDGGRSTVAAPSHVYAAVGNYTAHLWVNDSVGGSYTKTFAITVQSAGGGGGGATTSSMPGWTIWAIIGIIIVVAAAVAVLMMMRRRGSPPAAPPSGASGGVGAPPPSGAQ